MRRLVAVALCLVGAACGDNMLGDGEPLVASRDLVVVAHQDDDLLFMQPDVLEAVQHGVGVTTVYVTAGNGTHGVDAANKRYVGLMEAYGSAVHDMNWSCGYIELAHHVAQHCRLVAANLSLVFLAYPDGGREGQVDDSLLHLWEGTITYATTVADRTASYDRPGLIATIAEVMRQTQPRVVRTLEVASNHGHDHSDHMVVGALVVLALAQSPNHAELVSYRGYDIAGEPANKVKPILDASRDLVARYEACANDCAACGEACSAIDPTHEIWLSRRYAVGFRPSARGALQHDGQCLNALPNGRVELGDCTAPSIWMFDGGQLATSTGCLDVQPSGDLAVDACTAGASRRFVADDEDHVWSSLPPPPQPGMDFAHLLCLSPADDGPRAALCGGGSAMAPTWRIAPPLVTTTRANLGIAATGRAVRLGDLDGDGHADLCAVEPDGFYCAPGDGLGGFGPAHRIDTELRPFSIDPESLTLGDVDGDARVDACGRDQAGVLCTMSSQGFAVARFTPTFADAEARKGTSASLAAIDANGDGIADICGLAAEGVICTPAGTTLQPNVRSAWPDPAAIVWPTDLDGDHHADWCSTSPTGPACGVDAESALSRDGVAWGFAFQGAVEDVPADPAITGTADIDGDGDSDLCMIDNDRIACARSQGRGFGPRTTFAVIPPGATALWLGDLDGDGRADACVDLGATISCALAR